MDSPSALFRDKWRPLFRALLRECTYLPDPIARDYSRTHVVQRFRRYADKATKDQKNNVLWLSARRRSALHGLSLLRRANEGYSRPLEKVLRLAYGRIGRRRRELLEKMLAPEASPDNLAVADVVKSPAMFDDGWQPPPLVVHLLKAQESHYAVWLLGARYQVKTFHPPIPPHNILQQPVSLTRRRNIRRRWYYTAINSLYPFLPDTDLQVLEGLISGDFPWSPIKRRKAVGSQQPSGDVLAKFLAEGPQKGHTFRKYAKGRPHRFTRRFMRRLWRRIDTLVPRLIWNEFTQRHRIHWGRMRDRPEVAFNVPDAETRFNLSQKPPKPGRRKRMDDSD